MKFSIIIPVFNEEKAIADTINGVKKIQKRLSGESEIIVVNDGSTDRTLKIISKIGGITAISHDANFGYGKAIKTGTLHSKGKWIIIIDADTTYPIEDILKLTGFIGQYDMVVGARTGKNVRIPLSRRPAKWILNKLANYISSYSIPDLNSGLRVFKREIALKFWGLFPDGFSFTTTITVATICNGYNVKFIPINYYKRKGKSSIKPSNFLGFTSLIFKLSLFFRPLKIFIPASLILFLFGILRGIRDFIITNSLGDLSVIFFLSSLYIFFFGLLAELIVKRTDIRTDLR
ncbi:MAG: glycosyltransferase family 2 protein [Candidatus Aenigmarchaeota archaeon]|nr:glycosyltransferase family 2 protein [Candidatus Aenigmarchaeota archaeon]